MPVWYDAGSDIFPIRAELVQLIVSQSDSELEVQRYGMKINSLSLWLLMLSCWKMNCEWHNVKNRPQSAESVFENWTVETEFLISNFQFGSVRFFRRLISATAHL